MSLMRKAARSTALVLAVAIVASCDTRLPTSSLASQSDDVDRPVIKFALSTGVNNSVDVNAALTVTVTASDNSGIANVLTRISNAAQVIGIDTATIKPTQPSVTRVIPVPLSGLVRGDRIVIR